MSTDASPAVDSNTSCANREASFQRPANISTYMRLPTMSRFPATRPLAPGNGQAGESVLLSAWTVIDHEQVRQQVLRYRLDLDQIVLASDLEAPLQVQDALLDTAGPGVQVCLHL